MKTLFALCAALDAAEIEQSVAPAPRSGHADDGTPILPLTLDLPHKADVLKWQRYAPILEFLRSEPRLDLPPPGKD